MCSHLDDDISISLEADVLLELDARALTSFDDHAEMLNAYVLVWSHSMLITCSLVYLIWSLHSHMSTRFDHHMLTCSHTYMLWWLHAPMLTRINILKFDIHTLEDTLGWWFIYMLGGLSEHAVRCSRTQMFWRLCLNAKRYVYLGI